MPPHLSLSNCSCRKGTTKTLTARPFFVLIVTLLILISSFLITPFTKHLAHLSNPVSSPLSASHHTDSTFASSLHQARQTASRAPLTWYNHLLSHSPNHTVTTRRLACREYLDGGQACTFEGFICANATLVQNDPFNAQHYYFIDDTKPDRHELPSDAWCRHRSHTSDPRYFGTSAHWPIRNGTIIPQQSCLRAYYRTSASVFGPNPTAALTSPSILWIPSAIWHVDLLMVKHSHNFHVFMDTIWMLDVRLFHASLHLISTPDQPAPESALNLADHFFPDGPQHVYLPQGKQDFESQTSNDLTRLLYAITLDLDPLLLYPNQTAEDLRQPKSDRFTAPLLEAYPHLIPSRKLLFHRELLENPDVDLVCAPRLSAGPRQPNSGHERVCRELRKSGWELFGLKEPEMKRVGRLWFPQPPKKIVVLDRHLTRRIENFDEVVAGVRKAFEGEGWEVEALTTESLKSVERMVRLFAGTGVLITPHGGHCHGLIWMPRHRYVPP
eukprot:GFKZ01001687.1.p1 GENE.GFKZ01001687.1~~GFKZ01001687.1.p1  ORF type:complete len:498 (+),score=33.92 GFKZ01001687.1:252-1745(+)